MAKTFKATWLGDTDPLAQMIRMGDLAFVKGEAVPVPEDHAETMRIRDNPMFAIDDAKAEPVEPVEPSDDEIEQRQDEGTEKGAIKTQLRAMGISVVGNPSLDTLRGKLADAVNK